MEYKGAEMTEKLFELEIDAELGKLPEVMAFVDSHLEDVFCPLKIQMQVDVAVEEAFVNIASYAYAPGSGKAVIRLEITDEPAALAVTFIDQGVPFDPLAKEDPDLSLSAEERAIGGLGIYMIKKSMDNVSYEYKNGSNVFKLIKNLK